MSETDSLNLNHCKHFVHRKKRYCRMTVKTGQQFCGEHMPASKLPEDNNTDTKKRITCPLDPKHTCYAHKLKKHLNICNAREGEQLPYICKGINIEKDDKYQNTVDVNQRCLGNYAVEDIRTVIVKINTIFADIKNKITVKQMQHILIEEELKKQEYGPKTKKHLVQASSILGILNFYNFLKSNTCYIEFGAGKGQLSYWTSKVTTDLENSSVLLIERAAHRHKMDNKLDKTTSRVHRIRTDIADLILNKVEAIKDIKNVVGVTKHLCGEATDLALKCLTNLEEHSHKVLGAVMAFCCHHRCQWKNYVGKAYFKDVGLSENEFNIMCGMVSWATCGIGLGREKLKNINDNEIKKFKLNDRDQEIGLDRDEKAEIGKKAKYIINWGRAMYLEDFNFKTFLHFYVDLSISPENLCMVAVKNVQN